MEKLLTKLNDIERFDEVIKNSLPDIGDLEIITKDAGMKSGRGIVMLTFTVYVNGQRTRVQTVTTMRLFRSIANAIVSTYDDEGFRVNMADALEDGIITEGK